MCLQPSGLDAFKYSLFPATLPFHLSLVSPRAILVMLLYSLFKGEIYAAIICHCEFTVEGSRAVANTHVQTTRLLKGLQFFTIIVQIVALNTAGKLFVLFSC